MRLHSPSTVETSVDSVRPSQSWAKPLDEVLAGLELKIARPLAGLYELARVVGE